ncbi:hypothetical protein FRACA_210042 [Frankia canadensis]|uniref:Uncharacterized protein n=1 Tax=Frankia canadensis TaxID=1836972 RepID=A0A2I2KQL1_9ACTN|nr:hypothetical protein FRACA_210042 [Frankia canadensis]SOU55247.1 hypothetical protein FRACA_210042 [Frankia canadensis]
MPAATNAAARPPRGGRPAAFFAAAGEPAGPDHPSRVIGAAAPRCPLPYRYGAVALSRPGRVPAGPEHAGRPPAGNGR